LKNNAVQTFSGKAVFFSGSNFFSGLVPPVSPNFPPNGTPGFHKILPMSEFCSLSMRNESAKTHRTLANKAVPVILRYDI